MSPTEKFLTQQTIKNNTLQPTPPKPGRLQPPLSNLITNSNDRIGELRLQFWIDVEKI